MCRITASHFQKLLSVLGFWMFSFCPHEFPPGSLISPNFPKAWWEVNWLDYQYGSMYPWCIPTSGSTANLSKIKELQKFNWTVKNRLRHSFVSAIITCYKQLGITNLLLFIHFPWMLSHGQAHRRNVACSRNTRCKNYHSSQVIKIFRKCISRC